MALEDGILAALTREPGLKGREIASRLGLDKSLVNSTLYKLRLRKLAWQDSGYRWFLKSASRESGQTVQPQLGTPLTKLSRYYLHCLSLDDESGVSLFAQSRFSPEYIELPVLPEFDPEERSLASFAGVSEFSEAEPPELDEFIARLVEIREDWDWKEQPSLPLTAFRVMSVT